MRRHLFGNRAEFAIAKDRGNGHPVPARAGSRFRFVVGLGSHEADVWLRSRGRESVRVQMMAVHFRPFPKLPVYVCSRSGERRWHRIAPIRCTGDPTTAFRRLALVLAAMKRTAVVEQTSDYIHAVCRTPLGFTDDVKCYLCADEGLIHLRSASRIAPFWDFGANRRRVTEIRRRLHAG